MNILIIDDEPNIADALAWVLRTNGHVVATADSGEAGLAALKAETVDLVFLDVVMPGMGGLATLGEIRNSYPQQAVIMISGQADIALAVQATKLGAYDFLEKPLNPEKIILEVKNLAEQNHARSELARLQALVEDEWQMIGRSPVMHELRQSISRVAPTDSRVFIHGENGTGKEMVAHQIHQQSERRHQPFVQLNCAALPHDLIESELFGYEKGAFTGAHQRKIGLIERAQGGTLLLDEVGDMALETQAKLLRVLQENEFTRVGGHQPIRFDVRILAATNKVLDREIEHGRFRQDLYFRLSVIPVRVPALRERAGDIPELADHFLYLYCRRNGKKQKALAQESQTLLQHYDWPGNVRELKNIMERLAIMSDAEVIEEADVRQVLPPTHKEPISVTLASEPLSLKDQINHFEKSVLQQGLQVCEGNMTRLAQMLKTDRANLYKKLRHYGLKE
jgi:two-component system, NtrC family, nitrogen regulation response regulator NtrX